MRKNRKDKPPKNTDSVEFRRWMAEKLDGRTLRYILERDESGDRVIAKGGILSNYEGLFSVISGEICRLSVGREANRADEHCRGKQVFPFGRGKTVRTDGSCEYTGRVDERQLSHRRQSRLLVAAVARQPF